MGRSSNLKWTGYNRSSYVKWSICKKKRKVRWTKGWKNQPTDTKAGCVVTFRLDKRIPKLNVCGQGSFFRSLEHYGRSNEATDGNECKYNMEVDWLNNQVTIQLTNQQSEGTRDKDVRSFQKCWLTHFPASRALHYASYPTC